jgi:hypothetical protein
MAIETPQGRIFTPREAAHFLKHDLGVPISDGTLQNKRTDGTGPKFAKAWGRIEYHEADLREWVAQHRALKVTSTAEMGGQA